MSDPIKISVRDLTTEHLGWIDEEGDSIAAVVGPRSDGYYRVTYETSLPGDFVDFWWHPSYALALTPPPPPDPWEGVPMPSEAWAVQWVKDAPIGRLTPVRWCSSLSEARVWLFDNLAAREDAPLCRIVHLSARGAEVVE